MANTPGRPDRSVNRDAAPNLGESITRLSDEMRAQTAIMRELTQAVRAQLDMQQRYAGPGAARDTARQAQENLNSPSSGAQPGPGTRPVNQQQGSPNAVPRGPTESQYTDYAQDIEGRYFQTAAKEQGLADPTLGVTKVSGVRAASSLANFRAWAAQQIGNKISGVPISEVMRQRQQGGGGPSPGQTTTETLRDEPATSGGAGAGGAAPPRRPPSGGGGATGGRGDGGGGEDEPPKGGFWQNFPRSVPGFGDSGTHVRPTNRGANVYQPVSEGRVRLGQQIAQSGGSTSGIIGAVKHLPVIGLGIDVAQKVQQEYIDQREKNRQYQEVVGGTNAEGFAQRFHEEMYNISMPGMSGDAARQAFKGVTNLGYTGVSEGEGTQQQNRMNALNFVYGNYNRTGMGVPESLRVLQTYSQELNVSFRDLGNELKNVSEASKDAGVNAKNMREEFNDLSQEALQQGAGASAPQVAGAVATQQASYGRGFQNTDFGGEFGQQMQILAGTRAGLGVGQTQALLRNNPQQFANLVAGSQKMDLQNILDPKYIQLIQQQIEQYGGPNAIGPDQAHQIAQKFLDAYEGDNGNIDVLVQQISMMAGVQVDRNNVADWIVQQFAGNNVAAHAKQAAGAKGANQPVRPGHLGSAPTGKMGLAKGWDEKHPNMSVWDHIAGKAGTSWQEKLRDTQQTSGSWFGSIFGGEPSNKAADTYLKQYGKTGKRDPLLEGLLQNVKDPDNTHVRVQAKGGARVVTFNEAMQYFPQELASGSAVFVDGDQAGKNVQSLTGNIDKTRKTETEMKSNPKVGVSGAEWDKKHPKKQNNANSGGAQRVQVDLTPNAAKLLKIMPITNSDSDSQGAPPANNQWQGSPPGRGGG